MPGSAAEVRRRCAKDRGAGVLPQPPRSLRRRRRRPRGFSTKGALTREARWGRNALDFRSVR
ncbi:Hypothetical protein CAP_0717 [Chondromyces apiculatus DSM 436]|uniref:Uncharacterized protein n=1 Tax=Chondromyces apiculatus DSM 436 TaxID=1192034 RepID=A0A017TD68_9BACT|nr:Hypothetical protein CAP_0717 [Chondromyces apiculatus DSM 436]